VERQPQTGPHLVGTLMEEILSQGLPPLGGTQAALLGQMYILYITYTMVMVYKLSKTAPAGAHPQEEGWVI